MGDKFDLVMTYYRNGLWDIQRVKNAVGKGWITPAGYEEITGEKYTA